MELLQDTHVWYAISFVVFLGLVWKFGRHAILGNLDRRIDAIRKEIKTAETLRIEAQELLAQYQRKQRDALKDAERIINTARTNAEELRRKAEADLNESINRREAQLKERIERMEQSAVQEIQAYASELAMKAAQEIIIEKLDKKTAEKLADQSIQDVAKNLH